MADYNRDLIPYGENAGLENERWVPPRPKYARDPYTTVEEEPIEGEFREASDEYGPPPEGDWIYGSKGVPEEEESRRSRTQSIVEEFGADYQEKWDRAYWEAMSYGADPNRIKDMPLRTLQDYAARLKAEARARATVELTKTAAEKATKAATAVKKALATTTKSGKEISDLYYGRAKPGLYGRGPQNAAGDTIPPNLSFLRKALGFHQGGLPSPVGSTQRLFELQASKLPRNWSNTNKAVYAEIQANNDHDTPSHVVEELEKAGFLRPTIVKAIGTLRKLGYIKPSGSFYLGERELEITDKVPR